MTPSLMGLSAQRLHRTVDSWGLNVLMACNGGTYEPWLKSHGARDPLCASYHCLWVCRME